MLPYTDAQPASCRQSLVRITIPGDVGCERRYPPVSIVCRNSRMQRTGVQECQKQPSTKAVPFAPVNAISQRHRGVPGSGSSIRCPSPRFRRLRRNSTSGAVFLTFWHDIRLEVKRSVVNFVVIAFGPGILIALDLVERSHSRV